MTKIEEYYNKFHEDHRLTTRHGIVEFTVTMNIIEKIIKQTLPETKNQNIKIADIGAGTGRYSIELCHRNYDVTAVELVKHNLEILRSKHENIKTWQGDARNLSFLDDNTFDITLLFGPLYHLHGEENKLKAFSEAKRITKKDGIIFVAYLLNDYSLIQYCFKEHHWKEVQEKNALTDNFHLISTEEDLYDYVRLEDIEKLNKSANLERIKIIAPDGPADYMRRELNEMSQDEFEAFINFQCKNCERVETLGASSHLVDILLNKK